MFASKLVCDAEEKWLNICGTKKVYPDAHTIIIMIININIHTVATTAPEIVAHSFLLTLWTVQPLYTKIRAAYLQYVFNVRMWMFWVIFTWTCGMFKHPIDITCEMLWETVYLMSWISWSEKCDWNMHSISNKFWYMSYMR